MLSLQILRPALAAVQLWYLTVRVDPSHKTKPTCTLTFYSFKEPDPGSRLTAPN